ncbi:hypothetical protein ANHYDRO_00524 [Anaerococcus hydrogenalis DSM 7454]|uniref:Uncharacterized protein n=1 Tax=Anaerococcus hydrogenalis DSM 7454 TaxID=561177 RepID=B6W7H8_9FIRM|nr:hypothetical protein ANHYDRO_00524 [Anaerococcus hydrogenalis DSM 7454]
MIFLSHKLRFYKDISYIASKYNKYSILLRYLYFLLIEELKKFL